MIKNFIWDFDGMLFDTYPHTVAAFTEMFRRRGTVIDGEEAMARFKITMWDAFDYYRVSDEMREEFYLLENDLTFRPEGVPYPHIEEVLKLIKLSGGRNFLYTHRDKVATQYLGKYDFTRYFDGFVTSENNFPHKPAPDAVNYIIEKYSLDRDECMMLGDRVIDIGSGANAGIHTLLFDEYKNLKNENCSYYCNSTAEVLALVKENFGKN